MEAQARQNTLPNSRFDNSLIEQSRRIPGLPYLFTADDGTVSVFTKEGVNVFKEEDVLITCKGKPILIGVRDSQGRYRIPLMQQRGQWHLRRPSKQARKALRQANSVYDLPSTKQAIKWMHTVCGYPVKSTWLKAIKAGDCGKVELLEKNCIFLVGKFSMFLN